MLEVYDAKLSAASPVAGRFVAAIAFAQRLQLRRSKLLWRSFERRWQASIRGCFGFFGYGRAPLEDDAVEHFGSHGRHARVPAIALNRHSRALIATA